MRQLLQRLPAEGDRGVVHRSRGQPSNRKLPEAWRARACRGELVQWDTSAHAWLEGRGQEPYQSMVVGTMSANSTCS